MATTEVVANRLQFEKKKKEKKKLEVAFHSQRCHFSKRLSRPQLAAQKE
jgi:hypothetical protein